jgi:hypothetical protein
MDTRSWTPPNAEMQRLRETGKAVSFAPPAEKPVSRKPVTVGS